MTDFQRQARHELEVLLGQFPDWKRDGFQDIQGRNEFYLKETIRTEDHVMEVYLYEDEAGFLEGRQWVVFEKPDYVSGEELLRAFLSSLQARL